MNTKANFYANSKFNLFKLNMYSVIFCDSVSNWVMTVSFKLWLWLLNVDVIVKPFAYVDINSDMTNYAGVNQFDLSRLSIAPELTLATNAFTFCEQLILVEIRRG